MMWDFIQTQILGMKWLNILIGELLSALGLDIDSGIGSSIHFFIYDVIKIIEKMMGGFGSYDCNWLEGNWKKE